MSEHETLDRSSNCFIRYIAASSLLELYIMDEDPTANTRLTYRDVMYLNLIAEVPHCTASRLAELTNVSRPTITARIKSLERSGYVRRIPDSMDRRIVRIELTDKSVTLYEWENQMFESIVDKLREHFGDERLASFEEMLDYTSELIREDRIQ